MLFCIHQHPSLCFFACNMLAEGNMSAQKGHWPSFILFASKILWMVYVVFVQSGWWHWGHEAVCATLHHGSCSYQWDVPKRRKDRWHGAGSPLHLCCKLCLVSTVFSCNLCSENTFRLLHNGSYGSGELAYALGRQPEYIWWFGKSSLCTWGYVDGHKVWGFVVCPTSCCLCCDTVAGFLARRSRRDHMTSRLIAEILRAQGKGRDKVW